MKDLVRLKRWAKWRYVLFCVYVFLALASLTSAGFWLSEFDDLTPERNKNIGIVAVACAIVVFFLGLDWHLCSVLSYAAIDLEQTLNEIAVYKKKNMEKYQDNSTQKPLSSNKPYETFILRDNERNEMVGPDTEQVP